MSTYTQVTTANRGTTDYPGWCARFVFNAFGGKNGWGFSTAIEAWHGQKNKHPGERPPKGVDVPIWFSWTKDPRGHTAVSLSDGRVLSSPVSGTAKGQNIFSSIEALMAAFGGGMTYLGWGEQMDGTVVVKPAALEPTQRQVGPIQVIRRSGPSTSSAIKEPALEPGEIGNFDGWIRGESVNGINIWFRGISGDYFWSGGFTSQATTGLKDLNTSAPAAGQRQVQSSSPVLIRTMPSTDSAARGQLEAGAIITPEGWVNGQEVYGVKVWYKVPGGYSWAGAFTKSDTTGLKDLNSAVPEPEPEPERPDFEPFGAFHSVVTRVDPAHSKNYALGNFPQNQVEVVLHDFGTDGKDSFSGTISWFKNPAAETSAHFVVSGDEIVQMVSLENRAWHAGPGGNDRIGIEIDPAVGRADGDPLKAQTIASVRRLLIALEDNYGRRLGLRKHPEFMPTQCGDDIDLADYDVHQPGPEPGPEPEPEPGDDRLDTIIALLREQNEIIRQGFRLS